MPLKGSLTPIDINYLNSTFVTEATFDDFRSDIFTKLDRILKEILTMREENAIFKSRIYDHEDRIEVLEKIHPQGRHQS